MCLFRRHADDGEEEEEEEEDVEPQLRSEVRENSIVSNLIDSKLDVIAETPKWVEKSEEGEQQEEGDVESLIRLQIREMFEDRDEEEEENTGKNNEGEEEAEKNHDNSGWMELTWPGDEDEDSNLQVCK